jgi:acylpyruvate hydrolase
MEGCDEVRLVTYEADGVWRGGIEFGDAIVDTRQAAEAMGWDAGVCAALDTTRGLLELGPDHVYRLSAEIHSVTERLRQAGATHDRASIRLGPPVPDPQKIICIGLNYRDHAAETGNTPPAKPVFFAKFPTALVGPDAPIVPPTTTHQIDYEAELAVVISTPGRNIQAPEALSYVAGATAFNDVSARDLQAASSQWMGGKAIDTFGPCGPALVTLDELGDLQSLSIGTRVNGETLQDGNTASMIFTVAEIIAYLSTIMTLVPGDIIATGTPAGVGMAREPQRFLRTGDLVEIDIERIGILRNTLAAPA